MSVSAETQVGGGDPCSIDSDGDNVMDCRDACPQTSGSDENNGCPSQERCDDKAQLLIIAVAAVGIALGAASLFLLIGPLALVVGAAGLALDWWVLLATIACVVG